VSSLLHAIGQVFLFCVLVIVCAAVLRRVAMAAFGSGGSSPKAAKGRSTRTALSAPGTRGAVVRGAGRSAIAAAAHPSNSQVRTQARADIRKMREEFRLKDLFAQREHERANGTAGSTATATAAKPTIRQRLRLAPYDPAAQGPAGNVSGANGSSNGNGTSQQPAGGTSQPAAQGNGGPPARQSPPPPAQAPASTNGGDIVPAPSTAGAEQLIEGIQRIHAEAAAGGIRHKQAALKSANEASLRFSAMAQMISRTMSEPGNNYGPEITEPLGQAAQHLQAAAMAFGESDNALTSLIHMTVGELADSPRQAPHHSELSETGSPGTSGFLSGVVNSGFSETR
jgi:hypothetical protein